MYFQTFEKCSLYTKRDNGDWKEGAQYLGGTQRTLAGKGAPMRVLKALDLTTGKVVWEVPQPGPAVSWGGTLATATGIVFYAAEGGTFAAAEAKTGATLWSFETHQLWKASPMTYLFDGRQYIAIASNQSILTFALPE